jgi:tryptophan synthase alpha chain
MTRIDDTFARLRAEGKKAFVAYIMGGDPDFETSLAIMRGLPEAGVDIVELGRAFHRSDGRWPHHPACRAARP